MLKIKKNQKIKKNYLEIVLKTQDAFNSLQEHIASLNGFNGNANQPNCILSTND